MADICFPHRNITRRITNDVDVSLRAKTLSFARSAKCVHHQRGQCREFELRRGCACIFDPPLLCAIDGCNACIAHVPAQAKRVLLAEQTCDSSCSAKGRISSRCPLRSICPQRSIVRSETSSGRPGSLLGLGEHQKIFKPPQMTQSRYHRGPVRVPTRYARLPTWVQSNSDLASSIVGELAART